MKKKMIAALAASMVMAGALLVGCGGAPETLEGTTWVVNAYSFAESVGGQPSAVDIQGMMRTNEQPPEDAPAESVGNALTDQIYVTFGAGGKATVSFVGQTQTLEYAYQDGKLTLGGEEYAVDGDTIRVADMGVSSAQA